MDEESKFPKRLKRGVLSEDGIYNMLERNKEIMKILGQRIKAARIRKGYTQEELAEVMHVPKSTLSAYENDKVDIKGSVLVELSGHLDNTPNYLVGVEENSDDSFILKA